MKRRGAGRISAFGMPAGQPRCFPAQLSHNHGRSNNDRKREQRGRAAAEGGGTTSRLRWAFGEASRDVLSKVRAEPGPPITSSRAAKKILGHKEARKNTKSVGPVFAPSCGRQIFVAGFAASIEGGEANVPEVERRTLELEADPALRHRAAGHAILLHAVDADLDGAVLADDIA